MHVAGTRERLGPVWPLLEIFKDHSKEPMKIVNAYINPIVKDAIEKHRKSPARNDKTASEVEDDETVLDHLVKQTSGKLFKSSIIEPLLHSWAPDSKILKDETLNILLAGRDTVRAP